MLGHKPRCLSNSLRLRRCGPPPSLRPLPNPTAPVLLSHPRGVHCAADPSLATDRDAVTVGAAHPACVVRCNARRRMRRRPRSIGAPCSFVASHASSLLISVLHALQCFVLSLCGRRFAKGVHDQRLRPGLHHARIAGATHIIWHIDRTGVLASFPTIGSAPMDSINRRASMRLSMLVARATCERRRRCGWRCTDGQCQSRRASRAWLRPWSV